LHGLPKQVPAPVKGEVQGKFGAQRPDGGLWRGIVLRAPEGTPVHAVAAGRVVYANWLAGFGNIMIVDHGAKYLSVYAYNQSLLKQVGDMVQAGDTIAAVGATGGQVEPGLYFEIRHQGTPVNPLLWLSR
jgi:septal ring factor EnvC (AmiA/AmiB activator)